MLGLVTLRYNLEGVTLLKRLNDPLINTSDS